MKWCKLSILFLMFCCSCAQKEEKKITLLLDWFSNPTHIPLFVGEELGFFEEEGIPLTILKLPEPPSAVQFLETKKADIALFYMPSTLRAAVSIPDLAILGVYIKEPLNGFLFRKDSGISSLRDLHKKSLGLTPDNLLYTYANEAMKENQIEFKDVRKIQVDPSLALMANLVDVVIGIFWNIESCQLKYHGVECGFIPLSEFGIPPYYELLFVTKQKLLKREPTFKMRFQRALQKTLDYCRKHPEEAFALYQALHKGKGPSTLDWEKDAWHLTLPLFPEKQTLEKVFFADYMQWMIDHHLLESKIDLDRLLYEDF